ncbi:hypothetical protein O181_093396 [Austropuccinia psidii MF-1]|uniref:Uncharacterized protein n=1 Tax=Austropuccinia psidii MF-1 TaxID=1389203 RepID=A0A9Q3J1E5_9BASI|nr:hypothetical protein [Austropuccinia psidii MF-1]
MLPQTHQGVINFWHILKRFLKEEEIVKYCNGWNPLSSKPQIKKIKEWNKKKEASKEEASVASTRKPQLSSPPQEGKKNKKNNSNKKDPPATRLHGQCLQHSRTSMYFKDKEEKRMRQPSFPKK